MTDQKVNDRPVDIDRDVPVRFRRQTQNGHFLRGIKWLRNQVIGHVLPQELLKGPDTGGRDGVFGIDRHTELTGEETETKRIITATGEVVVVQIKAGGDTRVGGGDETVGVIDGSGATEGLGQKVLLEQGQITGIVIEFVDEEDVGIVPLDDLGNDRGLIGAISRQQFGIQRTVGITIQGGIECRHTDLTQQHGWEANGGDGDRKDP